jgi:hypothetical protein
MSVMLNAQKHFKSKISGGLEKTEVPEWNTTVYFRPTATLKETEAVVKLHQSGQIMESLATVLVLRALDEEGNRLFKQVDMFELMNSVDPEVVIRVATDIMNSEPSQDEIAKN